jgi:dihydrodipicolinate synthase/N-acetylneuraminate lyase
MLLDGLHLPLTTPFLPNGELNLRKLEANVARYAKTPAAGLAILSRTGQPSLLSDEESRNALRVAAHSSSAEKVLWAGIARDSVAGALNLIDFAAAAAYDVALLPLPSTVHSFSVAAKREREILTFFRTVADRSALPVVLDVSPANASFVSIELVAELAQHPNIFGLVDSTGGGSRIAELRQATESVRREVTVTMVFAAVTGRMLAQSRPEAESLLSANSLSGGGTALVAPAQPRNFLKTRKKTVGFQLLAGSTSDILDALQAGAVGALPPLASSAPQACYEVLAAWKDGDPSLAAEKQERLRLLAKRVEEELGVAGIKFGCDLNGYFGGRPRLPSLPLTGVERGEIERLMQGIRN